MSRYKVFGDLPSAPDNTGRFCYKIPIPIDFGIPLLQAEGQSGSKCEGIFNHYTFLESAPTALDVHGFLQLSEVCTSELKDRTESRLFKFGFLKLGSNMGLTAGSIEHL